MYARKPDPLLPWMGQRLFTRITLMYTDTHEIADEILGRIADLVPVRAVKLELALENLRKQVRIVFVVERWIAAQQNVGYDADAPDVDRFAVRFLCKHLGCHVAGRSAGRCHYTRVLHFGQAEITDHYFALLVRAVV